MGPAEGSCDSYKFRKPETLRVLCCLHGNTDSPLHGLQCSLLLGLAKKQRPRDEVTMPAQFPGSLTVSNSITPRTSVSWSVKGPL